MNVKKFAEFIKEGVRVEKNIAELEYISKWIENIWVKIGRLEEEDLSNFFGEISDGLGENVAEIIDGRFSADKLHYYQSGSTLGSGGIDTGDFINNFENIEDDVETILSKY